MNRYIALFSGILFIAGFAMLFSANKFTSLLSHVAYYCQSILNTQIIPIPYFLGLLPFILLFLVLLIATTKFLILNVRIHFSKRTLVNKQTGVNSLDPLLEEMGLRDKVRIIESKKLFAFCMGIKNQKIYISTKLVSHLTDKELKAVLFHEQYHLINHDTFTMILASITHSLFPFFPILEDLTKKYRVEREILADAFAVEKLQDSHPLLSALKKLIAYPTTPKVALASIAEHDTLEPRIYSLMNKTYTQRTFRIKHALITTFSVFILGAVLFVPVYAQELHHDHYDIMLLSSENGLLNSCINTTEKNTKIISPSYSH